MGEAQETNKYVHGNEDAIVSEHSPSPSEHNASLTRSICATPFTTFIAYAEQTAPTPTTRQQHRQMWRDLASPQIDHRSSNTIGVVHIATPAYYSSSTSTSSSCTDQYKYRGYDDLQRLQSNQDLHAAAINIREVPKKYTAVRCQKGSSSRCLLVPTDKTLDVSDTIDNVTFNQVTLARIFRRAQDKKCATGISFQGPTSSQRLDEEISAVFDHLPDLETARGTALNGVPVLGYFGPEYQRLSELQGIQGEEAQVQRKKHCFGKQGNKTWVTVLKIMM
ncbi:hypothetical protein B0J11DRAFT_506480 [Dendryphion nanum]|uniref:Uncharacterized protein n=1 Tax=Dendryphion nanum TaxID=256645 RepID=A0A9P9DUJ2_9PLEO|nr:hypothetical protein B0J11DRAFT_506480 [Dendryphion nanum]